MTRTTAIIPLMLKFYSEPTAIAEVEKIVNSLAGRYHIDVDKQGDILISLTEAVNNAIIHGNHCDESKLVKIKIKETNKRLAIQVSDEGEGFDLNNIPDPTCPERICECGGRGVFLMQRLCDRLAYTNGGSTVEMQFKLA